MRICAITLGCLLLVTVSFAEEQPGLRFAQEGSRFETRCGWFSNPTPGNASLYDKDGEWIIGVQGGHQAEGDWPTFKSNQWVRTNGSYGYGCACLRVRVDHDSHEVLEIKSSYARPLSACRKDPALKEPKE
ncbi:MAG: DUF4087 domain-containing protein [Blastocatellia bacterium]